MTAPRLAAGTSMQERGSGDNEEWRTQTRGTPHRPISQWHRALWWIHHHMTRLANGEWKDESGWGGHRSTVAPRSRTGYRERQRAAERDVHTTARHAQVLREEAAEAHRKGSRERADFYGSAHGSGSGERMVRGGGTRAREAYEAEQRAEYERRRQHPYFRPRGKAASR